jgi:hypothetical protein
MQCDTGRPCCSRCVQRGVACTGYRDEATLVFRYENEKVERRVRRRASDTTIAPSGSSALAVSEPSQSPGRSDRSDANSIPLSGLDIGNPRPWLKSGVAAASVSDDDRVVSAFFERFVMYPCNRESSGGFLEYLPCMFEEVNSGNRVALRWAVRAAAYASLSKHRQNDSLQRKASQCYGLALSALAKSLGKSKGPPDDYILMTVVVLDLLEVVQSSSQRKGANPDRQR